MFLLNNVIWCCSNDDIVDIRYSVYDGLKFVAYKSIVMSQGNLLKDAMYNLLEFEEVRSVNVSDVASIKTFIIELNPMSLEYYYNLFKGKNKEEK